jgi:3-oxoacyl-[acyl-carrier protein] reductase
MQSLAQELASSGVTVNCICPGIVDTDRAAGVSPAAIASALTKVPMGRSATPNDIAHAVAFLCSPGASYITGQSLNVDGGWQMR